MSQGCLGSKEDSLKKRFSTAGHMICSCAMGRASSTWSAVSQSVCCHSKNYWLQSETGGFALASLPLTPATMKDKKEAQCASSGRRQLLLVDEWYNWSMIQVVCVAASSNTKLLIEQLQTLWKEKKKCSQSECDVLHSVTSQKNWQSPL